MVGVLPRVLSLVAVSYFLFWVCYILLWVNFFSCYVSYFLFGTVSVLGRIPELRGSHLQREKLR